MVLVVVAGAFAADGIYVGLKVSRQGRAAIAELRDGASLLKDARTTEARSHGGRALSLAQSAASVLNHPAMDLARVLPILGNDASAVADVVRALELAARAEVEALGAAATVGIDSGELGGFYSNGSVNVSALQTAMPSIGRAVELLSQAARLIDEAPRAHLRSINTTVVSARSQVRDAAVAATKARGLFSALPNFLGAEGRRRYLLAFQALGESRGTGGVIGFVGELTATNGRLKLRNVGPYADLFSKPLVTVSSPPWFAKSYGPQSALTEWTQANVSPNFPVTAGVLLRMYEQATGRTLDGVIAMDPIALADLLKGIGPIDLGNGAVLSADNAAAVLMHDSYVDLDPGEQNVFLAHVLHAFWDAVEAGPQDVDTFVHALDDAVATQHLKLYSSEPEEEHAFETVNAAGDFRQLGPDVQLAFHENYGVNKVDYYLHQKINMFVRLSEDGTARVQTLITLSNDAPESGSAFLLGEKKPGFAPGTNKMLFNTLIPRSATDESFQIDGREVSPLTFMDSRRPVLWSIIRVPPGGSTEVELDYTYRPAGSSPSDPAFSMNLFPQTAVNASTYDLQVFPPVGYDFTSATGLSSSATQARASGTLDKAQTFTAVAHRS